MKEHFLAQNPPVKKRVLFDLAVPADIEPEMSQVPETVCYSMEDMQELARQNNAAKLEALPKAKAILSKYEEQFVLMEIFSVRADCFFIPFFNDINSMVQR